MFGYVRYDLPNLYIKDYALYKALYCGLCKGIGEVCGQTARLALSYDMTFLSALVHNIGGVDVKIEKQRCFEHTLKKTPIAVVDEMTRALGALNTMLLYYKLTDDIEDEGKGNLTRSFFKKSFRRAKKAYPEMASVVEGCMREQAKTEKKRVDSPERAADPTASMMKEISVLLLKERSTPHTEELFYALGKWVYLIDALDDYDKDVKKKAYNPFFLAFGKESRGRLMQENGEEVCFYFDRVFTEIRTHLSRIEFHFNRDLVDNVLLRGIPAETARVMKGEKRKEWKEQIK